MDVAELVPRVRRAIEGPASTPETPGALSEEQITAITADAIASVIFYTDGRWGFTLSGNGDTSNPEWTIAPDPSLPEQTVIVAQAALDYFFFEFSTVKTRERLSNEATEWEYEQSAQLLTERFKLLIGERDKALEVIEGLRRGTTARFASFIAVRDAQTSALIEPWVAENGGVGGQTLLAG